MGKSWIVKVGVAGFICGIIFSSVWNVGTELVFFVAGFVVALSIPLYILAKRKMFLLLTFFVIAFASGATRLNNTFVKNQFESVLGNYQEFEGVIIDEPDLRPDKQLLTIRPESFDQNILITLSTYTKFHYGDRVWVQGTIKPVENFSDFDYQKYLERYDIYALMSYPRVITLRQEQGSPVILRLLRIKSRATQRIRAVLGPPQSDLLLGILIGARSTLPKDVTEQFRVTGLSHIVAVSGYNISIIVASLSFLPRLIGRRWTALVSTVLIIAFVILTGGSSSVVRAGIMGILLLSAANVGRLYSSTVVLFLTLGVMAALNPRIVVWDVGFQLSFAAMVGILYLAPQFEKITVRLPNFFGLKPIVLTTLAVLVVTGPITIWQFGQLSLIAPVMNSIILPLVPLVMLGGALTLLPVVGSGFAWLTDFLLRVILTIVAAGARVPHAQATIDTQSKIIILSLWLIFIVVAWIIYRFPGQSSRLSAAPRRDIIAKQISKITLNV